MRKNQVSSPCPSSRETRWGFIYLAFQILLLPGILAGINLDLHLNTAELNFVFFFINFLAILIIFHDFLGRSAEAALRHPAYFCQAVVLGTVAYFACARAVEWITGALMPGFSNANDASIAAMTGSRRFLMMISTVVLVPPVEECLYRGLIFRKLYGRSRIWAYVLSMLSFAMIHILGYFGTYSPLEVCMAVLQYLPAGLCLAWAYAKADTIFAPIVIHAIVNAVGIYRLR